MKIHMMIMMVFLLNFVSCGEDEFFLKEISKLEKDPKVLPPIPIEGNFVTDIYVQEENKTIDILWVIDNSGSMGDEQIRLAQNFETFIHNFIAKDIHFKMAVTTTDATNGHLGELIGNFTDLTYEKSQINSVKFINDFKNTVNVGTGGSGTESGLATSLAFLKKYKLSFIRPNANLAIIYMSDEEDQSPGSVESIINQIKGLKLNAGQFKSYSITAFAATKQSSETTGYRYQQAVNLSMNMGANANADINLDFHQSLDKLGEDIANLVSQFSLSEIPLNNTDAINVYVNGLLQVRSVHYDFNNSAQSIKFRYDHIPKTGDEIKIVFEVD